MSGGCRVGEERGWKMYVSRRCEGRASRGKGKETMGSHSREGEAWSFPLLQHGSRMAHLPRLMRCCRCRCSHNSGSKLVCSCAATAGACLPATSLFRHSKDGAVWHKIR